MCRLLGSVSVPLTSVFAPLVETDKSLWRQSFADPRQPQRDGWGLAWYPNERPLLAKSPRPMPSEKKNLIKAARSAHGRIHLFHLRRASNPRGVALSRLRGLENTQPFRFKNWTFVHNGSIPFPDETARCLGAYRRRVRGMNDSEVLFWLIVKELGRRGSVPAALRAARRALKKVAAARSDSVGHWHRGLNIFLSNGRSLWAYAESPPLRKKISALCSRGWPYYRPAFLPRPDRVWVASEPLWSGGRWRSLGSGELLEVHRRAGGVAWKKQKLIR